MLTRIRIVDRHPSGTADCSLDDGFEDRVGAAGDGAVGDGAAYGRSKDDEGGSYEGCFASVFLLWMAVSYPPATSAYGHKA